MSVDQLTSHPVETLYHDHHTWLRGWLQRRLNNSSDASDLAQDTFVNVITTGYAGDIREPRPFLATIARRLLAHRHRRHVLENAYLEALAALPDAHVPAPEQRLMAVEALQDIDRALAGLPRAVREAFLLAQLEGLTYDQIAARLGVSASSVKQYLTRANRQVFEDVSARLRELDGAAAYRALSPMAADRRKTMALLLGIGMAGAAGALAFRSEPCQRLAADMHTGVGERRAWTLSDGTRLMLNTASAVNVEFDERRRLLKLVAGEIMIVTGHAEAGVERPFLVQTADGRVQALGTAFTVRRHAGQTEVSVQKGAVQATPADAPGAARMLRAGEQTTFSSTQIEAPTPASTGSAAWTMGAIVADNMRLADFLAELGRHRHGVLRCDPAVADLRFSGVFPLKDTDAILSMLPNSLPVRISSRTAYWVTVERK
ncbi:sigma-70 family RNA polymerase sigma factor [Oxalobacteraceae bacterium OTU3REALA1]|nr:sigma-70 family RNA polymerase sigma factor [Oxalobacteraceae bacterium OTU3REALA1]